MNPPAFQFYADDFLAGTMDMDQAEVGAYIRLLCVQWNRGSLPVEPSRVARLAGGSVSDHVLGKFPTCDDGLRRNRRLEVEREKQAVFRKKQREKGILSGMARRTTVEPRLNHGCVSVGTEREPETNSPSPSPSPSPLPTPESISKLPIGEGVQGKRVKTERKPANGLQEVKDEFHRLGGSELDALDFWDWYEGNGWTQGKARTPLRQWKNAANRWIRNANDQSRTPTVNGGRNGRHDTATPANARNESIGTPETRAAWERESAARHAAAEKRILEGEIPFS